jgi:hypothetical protein
MSFRAIAVAICLMVSTEVIAASEQPERSGDAASRSGATTGLTGIVYCQAFEVSPKTIRAEGLLNSQIVTVKALPEGCYTNYYTAFWSAYSNEDWLRASPSGGQGSGATAILWAPNTRSTTRRGIVKVAGTEVEVVQPPSGIDPPCTRYEVLPSIISAAPEAGSAEVRIRGVYPAGCNSNWSALNQTSWLSVTPTSGDESNVKVKVSWTRNESGARRKGSVWIAGITVNVTQEASPVCPAGELCLANGRFSVVVSWKDFSGRRGTAMPVVLTRDSGYFWFFDEENVELVFKVVDGRQLNGHWWLFYGALSNVEYTVSVRDQITGAERRYFNPSGDFASAADTTAFKDSLSGGNEERSVEVDEPTTLGAAGAAAFGCVADATHLCLRDGRFRVRVSWRDFQGQRGEGVAAPLTSDTGYFHFFNRENVEVVVKILDGVAFNRRYWVFFGSLSNVEYVVTVTDLATGAEKNYINEAGSFGSVGDTEAFPAP